MRHIDAEVLAAIKEDLSALKQPTTYSGRQAVAELLPEIRAAMNNGYTLAAIAERISKEIPISPTTLRGYLYGKDAVQPTRKRRSA